jgi:regulation of enolase protein 1 (concanavalin A-like superfamily)
MQIDRRFDFARVSCLLALIVICSCATAFAAVPSPWATQDVGSPALAGSASYVNGAFTVAGGGRDIWGTSDQFRFVYRRVTGDFQIIARVDSITQAHEWSKAGVMIRTSLDADAPHAYVDVSAARGIWFQYRTQPAGLSTSVAGATGSAPRWLKLVRTGTRVKAYTGVDGGNWTSIGASTLPLDATVYAGIAVTSHNTAALATAVVSQVSVGSLAIPSSQRAVDIGTPAIAGSTTYSQSAYTILAAGADIWSTSDQFHFVYQPITGDVDVVARVASLKNTNPWAKAGVMIRESLSAGSRHAYALVSASSGYAFHRRIDTSGFSNSSGAAGAAPGWVRLVRTGYQFKAFRSADGLTWTSMGTDTIPMSESVYVGLAVTSHTVSAATTAVVDHLTVTALSAPSPSNQRPVVSLTAPGSGASFMAPANIAVTASATDPENRLARVDFLSGTTKIGTATTAPYSMTWAAVPAGTYSLTAVAYDADGGSASSSTAAIAVQSAAANKVPTISLTAPALGAAYTAPATVIISATAVDPEGRMARVEFYNGTTRLQSDTTAPYSFSWSSAPAGTYALKAIAYDVDGGSATSPIATITVSAPSSGGIWTPAVVTPWQWQLTGTIDQSVNASMYDIDLFDTPATVVASLHAKGRKAVCYMSAGTWEDWRPDASAFPASVLGSGNGWPGEKWLDIRRLDVLGPIMGARMDLCKQKGFDGIEPDNIDGYSNNSGFPLTGQDQITYNKWLAAAAHARGLSIGLKNDLEQVSQLVTTFDWAINEQCFEYNECNLLAPFTQAGKAVFVVEYALSTTQFCDKAVALKFNALKKTLNLDASRTACPSPVP